jgi:hypothetical protein
VNRCPALRNADLRYCANFPSSQPTKGLRGHAVLTLSAGCGVPISPPTGVQDSLRPRWLFEYSHRGWAEHGRNRDGKAYRKSYVASPRYSAILLVVRRTMPHTEHGATSRTTSGSELQRYFMPLAKTRPREGQVQYSRCKSNSPKSSRFV